MSKQIYDNNIIRPLKLDKIVCPKCKEILDQEDHKKCKCGFIYRKLNGIPVLRDVGDGERIDYRDESCTLPIQDSWKLDIKFVQEALASNKLVLQLGSGVDICDHPFLVKSDAFIYSNNLDYVVDAHSMPFEDSTFDFIYSLAVFEHLHSPWIAAKEISRVLKPGGKVYILTAFIQHLHGYPHHYFNMTVKGLEHIFTEFDILHSGPSLHCPLDQITVILQDIHYMASNLNNKSSKELSQNIQCFGEILNDIQFDLVRNTKNQKIWERIAPGVEIIAQKPY